MFGKGREGFLPCKSNSGHNLLPGSRSTGSSDADGFRSGGRREGRVGDLIGGMRICTVTNNSTNKNRSTTQLDSARRSGTRSRTPLQQLALHHGCRVTHVFSLLARRFKADKRCTMFKGFHAAFCAGVARKKTGRNKSRAALRMRPIVECWSAAANRAGSPCLSPQSSFESS